ncbi:MAG: magnesium/cobalt transporter CorA [Solirubrobacterales bacterium]
MIIDCAHYRDGARQHAGPIDIEHAASCVGGAPGEFVWVGLHEPTEAEMERASTLFGLPELAVEDATRAHQRPKIEDYEGSFFIVLRPAVYHDDSESVEFGEIDIFVGPAYAIHVRHGEASELRGARQRLEDRPELLRMGPASVAWAILDQVVDDYLPVTEGIDDDIEEVESAVFDGDSEPTERIYFLKREVMEFHRAVWPLLGPLEAVAGGSIPAVDDHLRRYLRDVHDHARRIDEIVNSQRELLTSALEANLALVSVNQAEVVKRISAWAAIIAVPTFIASVYGMNFEHMPELNQRAGYPLALLVMGLSVLVLFRFFRRLGWL